MTVKKFYEWAIENKAEDLEKVEMKEMKPHNCMECENSRITIQNNYCQCKITGNCYIPVIMADKISEDCPLYYKESEDKA